MYVYVNAVYVYVNCMQMELSNFVAGTEVIAALVLVEGMEVGVNGDEEELEECNMHVVSVGEVL